MPFDDFAESKVSDSLGKGASLCVLTVLRFSWDIIVCILPLGFFAWSLLWLVIVSPLRIWFVYVVNMHLHLCLCLCLCAHCNARMSAREIKWEETYNSLNHMDNRLFTKQTANKNAAMAQIKQINCVAPVCVCGAAFLSSKPMTLELLQFFYSSISRFIAAAYLMNGTWNGKIVYKNTSTSC